MRHLLEGDTYSDQSVDGAVLIRGWCLFEVQCLLEEIRYDIKKDYIHDKSSLSARKKKISRKKSIFHKISSTKQNLC